MIEIWNQSLLAHWENTNRISKTFIISFYLLFTCTEDRIVPVTEKLHSEPKHQYGEKNPLPSGLKEMVGSETNAK